MALEALPKKIIVKPLFYSVLFVLTALSTSAQNGDIIFPSTAGWNIVNENDSIVFQLKTSPAADSVAFSAEGIEGLNIQFDAYGNFFWKPGFDVVDRVERSKDITIIFEATFPNGSRLRKPVTFTVQHVNRPPVADELPVVYVKQGAINNYQIPGDYVSDPDNDPLVFRSIPTQMPEGAVLSSQGQFSWAPSRGQFYALRSNPLTIEFIIQDQPDKTETIGRLRIRQTQQDLAPEILIVPGDSLFRIKEDETINLKLYVNDPNGDDDVKSISFIANDPRVPMAALKENTPLQHEFTWEPGYDYTDDVRKTEEVQITFYAIDKTNNRGQRKIKILVTDTENIVEKDALQYQKYRNNLISAMLLVNQLSDNQKKLTQDYKKAKKGKKKRSILNASLGAATGLSPVTLGDEQAAKSVSVVGGTTVLTLGTLEATEVIGKSKEDILEKIRINIDILNKVQAAGDEFARKYSLKSARRNQEFEKDIDKFRAVMNDQKLVLLELDAQIRNANALKATNKDIKKVFIDFNEE